MNDEELSNLTQQHADRQGRHIINVFVWPSDQKQEAERAVQSGFNLLHWSDGGMQVWGVSDMENRELERFGLAWLGGLAFLQIKNENSITDISLTDVVDGLYRFFDIAIALKKPLISKHSRVKLERIALNRQLDTHILMM